MITAYGDADTRSKALSGGAEALLTKPVDFIVLRNEIDMRVGLAR
jgi:DNA-binding response OmpR family regulator